MYDQKDPLKEYAMKVEKKIESRRHSKLKMEVGMWRINDVQDYEFRSQELIHYRLRF